MRREETLSLWFGIACFDFESPVWTFLLIELQCGVKIGDMCDIRALIASYSKWKKAELWEPYDGTVEGVALIV